MKLSIYLSNGNAPPSIRTERRATRIIGTREASFKSSPAAFIFSVNRIYRQETRMRLVLPETPVRYRGTSLDLNSTDYSI